MRKWILWLLAISLLLLHPSAPALGARDGETPPQAAQPSEESAGSGQAEQGPSQTERPVPYSQALAKWKEQGAMDAQRSTIGIAAGAYRDASGQPDRLPEQLAGTTGVAALNGENDWLEYEFEADEAGLYVLNVKYMPLPGSFGPVQIAVAIDGQSPFKEASGLHLNRVWKDQRYPPEKDERGSDIRPRQEEITDWFTRALTDATSSYEGPLRWFLGAGKHRIRIQTLFDPVVLARLEFAPPELPPAYADAEAAYPEAGEERLPGWYTTLEAERMAAKSDSSLQMEASMDDLASPKSNGNIIFNMMGGERWKRGGQWAEWEFEVPEDGRYEIHLKYFQGYRLDATVFRTISIDGKVPFRELEAYPFTYGRSWQLESLGAEAGKPFRLYLKAGRHVLRLEATQSPVGGVQEAMREVMLQAQQLSRTVRMVTGIRSRDPASGDPNRDWELDRYIPDIREQFSAMVAELEKQLEELERIYGRKISGGDGIRSAISELKKLRDNPNLLPRKPEALASVQETLGTFAAQLAEQPLAVDLILIAKPNAKLPDVIAGWWARLVNTVRGFFRTFSPDYAYYGRKDEDAITVWVNRGRDYVTLMQRLADETFTPQTGIKVNINLMPNPQLLILSNAAGREPDAALGLDSATIADFAMRNALVDLNRFDDYAAVAGRFHPGMLLPLHYKGADYGLPETVSPSILFVRTDIMEALGLKAPDTWDEVKAMLPSLQQKGYDFYMPPLQYLPFFYQNGAELYTPDGMQSGLDSPEAFAAFKQWTDLFTVYGFPREVPNFYMHFRSGDMPVGIADFNTYLQLLVAAPEIAGSWSIYPIPGIRKGNEVERWSGGPIQAGAIFKTSQHAAEAWTFMKWWTSTDVQTRFGVDIEQIYGVEFRWNTADMNALRRLPWPQEDAAALFGQLSWFKEAPNVPGSYFTPRQLGFAWNRTVLERQNYRESLENGILEINREMLRKLQEFGLVDKRGNRTGPLDLPRVEHKWEGGETR